MSRDKIFDDQIDHTEDCQLQKGSITRGVDSNDLGTIEEWCANYHNYGVHPVDINKRFMIGFYQISQAIIFQRSKSDQYYTSLAEAFLHFLMVYKVLHLPMYHKLFVRLEVPDYLELNQAELLFQTSCACRMLVYRESGTSRRSKYNSQTLADHLGKTMWLLMSAIPRWKRRECIFDGSENMCANLGKFKP